MSRSLGVAVALAVALTGATVLAQPPVPLSGSVKDIYSRDGYLEGARVTITSHRGGVTVTVITGPDGTFSLPAVAPGTYTISVTMPGYGSLVSSNFCVVPGKPAVFQAALGPLRERQPAGASAPAHAPGRDPTVTIAPRIVPSAGAMSSSAVREAMEFGRRGTGLDTYDLKTSGRLRRRRTGRLFTPFWRVAAMTQVAAAVNKPFVQREIPAPLIEELVWIIGFPAEHYVNGEREIESTEYLAPVSNITIRPAASRGDRTEIEPAWKIYLSTECDVNMLESVFGRRFVRPAILAAFPMDVLKAGNTILFTYSSSAFPMDTFHGIEVGPEVRRVVISDSDVRTWK